MKKTLAGFVLAFVVLCFSSVSIFADGDINIGGKGDPSNPPPTGGFAAPADNSSDSDNLNTVLAEVIGYLQNLFG